MTKQVKFALIFLAAAVCVSCAFLLLRPKAEGASATITQDSAVLYQIDLSGDNIAAFTVRGENGLWNEIQVEEGRIRVARANCPDQVCVHQGWISDSSIPIVCLPNKLVIEVSGEEAQVDAAVK